MPAICFMTLIKEKTFLLQWCKDFVQRRLDTAREAIAQAQEAADEETKSVAGDKYETGRAMAQLDMEKHRQQWEEARKLMQVLERIDPAATTPVIQTGSVVYTDQGNFFISISAGKVQLDQGTWMVVSAASPIASAMLGRRAAEQFVFQGKTFQIQQVM